VSLPAYLGGKAATVDSRIGGQHRPHAVLAVSSTENGMSDQQQAGAAAPGLDASQQQGGGTTAAPPPPPGGDENDDVLATIRRGDLSAAAIKSVRLDFNVSGDPRVTEIKALSARLMSLSWGEGNDAARCGAIARTHFETACMYAVKAATAEK